MSHSSPQPPQWPLRLIRRYGNPELVEEIQGDLYESFIDRVNHRGVAYARWRYVWEALAFLRPGSQAHLRVHHPPASRGELFWTYTLLSARYLLNHKAFLLINVLGLALGIATCLAIMHYVRFELGYDTSHVHAQRIYRVSTAIHSDGSEEQVAPTVYGLAPALQANYEEVEAAVRLVPTTAIIKQKDGTLASEDYFFLADPEIFQVFTHPMLAGDPARALQRPNSVVLSQSMAKKYLGNAPPASLIGSDLVIDGQTYQLTGIIEDVPKNSDLRFDALLSWEYNPDEWLELGSFTYLLLKPDVQPEAFAQKLADFDQQIVAPRVVQDWGTSTITVRHQLYPLTDLHYTTHLLGDTEEKGNKNYVYIFSFIAIIILIVAGVNYVNLFIAQATRRNVEVGVAKAMGASQWQLGRQYISECFIISLLALVLALAIVLLAGQTFANLLGTPIVWQTLVQSDTLGILLSLVLLISILAGSYPALVLASSRAVVALKGPSFLHRSRGKLRKVFIAFQFTVAISLVAGALIVREQVFYMRHKDLGFQQQETAAVSIPYDTDGSQKALAFKQQLQQDSRVDGVTIGSRPDGLWSWSSVSITAQGQTKTVAANGINVDEDYLRVLKLPLIAGQNFIPSRSQQIIVNEAFVKQAGWDDPVGQEVVFSETDKKEVIGVVKDFHFAPLHEPIEPLILFYDTSVGINLIVAIAPSDLEAIETVWPNFFPNAPFEFEFLDQALDHRYRTEQRLLTLFNYFSGLSIFVACLGLLGLTAFTVQQKTKEIGIRKVLGANRRTIMYLLSREFAVLLLIAAAVATPVAWLAMRYWLQDFAYRTTIEVPVFLWAIGSVALLALITLSYHTLKAAATNPTDSLRYE